MEFLRNYYPYNDILLVYECGSKVYDVKSENSDSDFIVVISDYNGMDHLIDETSKNEYYVFGVKQWISKMEFKHLSTEFLAFNEEILGLDKTLVYLDASFEATFNKYKSRDFKEVLNLWLESVLDYFGFYVNRGTFTKNLYRLIGISYVLSKYEETGSFLLDIPEDVKAKMLAYKEAEDKSKFSSVIEASYKHIRKVALNL